MGFLPATGFGAGAGGQMLQQIQDAQQRAAEIAQQQELARQHLLLDQQEMQQKSQLAQATLQSVNQQRQAEEQRLADARAGQATGMLTPQTVMSPTSGILKMVQGTPYESLFQPDQSLGSANISGAAGGPMNVTANPGQATGQVRYLGTPGQLQQQGQDAARGRIVAAMNAGQKPDMGDLVAALSDKGAAPAFDKLIENQFTQPKADKTYEVTVPGPNGQPMRKLVSAADLQGGVQEYKAPQQPPLQLINTTDDNGNKIQQFVVKKAGQTYAAPNSATVQNRVESAKAVNQTGDDIIKELQDPNFKNAVGPVLGRYSSLRDFIGNPPPEYAQLAGQIESYALANMGVHGMRSAQGAMQISHLLDAHHTPESLVAAIQGLQGFSKHFIENTGGGGGTTGSTTQTAAESPAHRVWRLLGGQGSEPK